MRTLLREVAPSTEYGSSEDGHPVKFELSEHTRHAIDDYLQACAKQSVDYLFTGRRGTGMCLTTRQFARLVSGWLSSNGVDALQFGTHSLRRAKRR